MHHYRTSLCAGVLIGLVVVLAEATQGCSSKTVPNSAYTPSEIAESVVSGSVNSTELNGTQSSYESGRARGVFAGLESSLRQSFSLGEPAYAATACPHLANSTCSGGDVLMTYNACSFGASSTVWSGSQIIHFSGGCQPIDLVHFNSLTLTRTFGAGTTETTSGGVITTFDTTTASTSGWDTTNVTGVGNGINATFRSTTGDRTLTILGLHLHATDSSGTTLFDHTLTSDGLLVSGTGTDRVVALGGLITVQHNIGRFTAQAHITTALSYGMANCCHPSAGTLTTSLSGARVGTEVLNFTGGSSGHCGSATFTDAGGTTAEITLTHCY